MPSADDPAAGLTAACIAVKPPGPGVCEICCTGVEAEYPVCFVCRDIQRQIDHALSPITPISLTTADSQVYTALFQYKSGRAGPAEVQRHRLAALLSVFLRVHLGCVAPGGVDTVLVVPSLSGRRPSPHPLFGVVGMTDMLPPLLDCLQPGTAAIGHRQAARDAVTCTRSLTGRRVLLVDDTYTSGACLQSSAYAAAAAGATTVHPIVFGRFMRKGWAPSNALLGWSTSHPWDPERCIHCSTG